MFDRGLTYPSQLATRRLDRGSASIDRDAAWSGRQNPRPSRKAACGEGAPVRGAGGLAALHPSGGASCKARRGIREDLRPPVSVSAPAPRTRPQRRREATHAWSWLPRAAETVPAARRWLAESHRLVRRCRLVRPGCFGGTVWGQGRRWLAKRRWSARQCGWQTALVGRGAGWQRGAGWKNAAGWHASDGWQNAFALHSAPVGETARRVGRN